MRNATQAIVLLDAAGAIRIDRHLRQVAIVIRIGSVLVAEEIAAESLQLRVTDKRRIGLVFLARQMGAPRRQAGSAGNPQAVHR